METTQLEIANRDTLNIEDSGKMCPSFQVLEMVMDKWTPKIIFLLQDGPLHYMQLKRQVGGGTQKMVTQTLRKLEKAGLVSRTVYPTSPPTVEYALTPLGKGLQEAFQELLQWARVYTRHFPPMRESNVLIESE